MMLIMIGDSWRWMPLSKKIYLGLILLVCSPLSYGGSAHQPRVTRDVIEILDSYQQTAGRWFVASHSFKVQIDGQAIDIPAFVWVANLIPPRLLTGDHPSVYQLCSSCLLDDGSHSRMKQYLRHQPHFWHGLTDKITGLKKFTNLDYWRHLRHRGEAYLVQLHRERGTLTSLLVALTWLPYTTVTEVVIEPMLIGPLHTICPLFQVAYFATLDFTHSLFRNIHHTLTFAADKIPLTTRVKLAFAGRQTKLPTKVWHTLDLTIDQRRLNSAMAMINGDALLEAPLKSSLGATVAVNLIDPPVPPTGDLVHNEQEIIQRELSHQQRWRRVYFVNSLTTVAITLSELVTKKLNQEFADDRLFESHRQRRASIGTVRKEIFALSLTLSKLISSPQTLSEQTIAIDFHQLATIVEGALNALIDALDAINNNHDDYPQLVATFSATVKQLNDHPYIINLVNPRE